MLNKDNQIDDKLMTLIVIDISYCERFFDAFGMIVTEIKSIITSVYNDIIFLGHHYYGSRVIREEFTCFS